MPFYRAPRITIHKDLYTRQFMAKSWSSGYILSVIITILVIFLPFITTYSTGGKLKHNCKQKLIFQSFLVENRNFNRAPNRHLQKQTLRIALVRGPGNWITESL